MKPSLIRIVHASSYLVENTLGVHLNKNTNRFNYFNGSRLFYHFLYPQFSREVRHVGRVQCTYLSAGRQFSSSFLTDCPGQILLCHQHQNVHLKIIRVSHVSSLSLDHFSCRILCAKLASWPATDSNRVREKKYIYI